MIVLDASAAIELLLHTPAGGRIAARISDVGSIHCPHLIDVEIAQTLRRLTALGEVSHAQAHEALSNWRSLDVQRYPHFPFLERAWALRENFSVYDAVYVALGEILEATIVTGDRKLTKAPGTSAKFEVFA